MLSETMIVDVSRDWVLACDVQQRFMQSLDRMAGTLDYSGQCRQLQALGGDCFGFSPLADGRLALTNGCRLVQPKLVYSVRETIGHRQK